MSERLLHLLNLKLNSMRTVVAEAERFMLRDHPMQCATCAKCTHDAERCCMVCELHHSGVLQGGLQAIQQCVCCAD